MLRTAPSRVILVTSTGPTCARRSPTCHGEHPDCFVCGPTHPAGLKLSFKPQGDGSVAAEFDCAEKYQGYAGMVHGGIVASLLDGAMTNCLFVMGHVAVTGDLHVRFRHPLHTGQGAIVRAQLTRAAPPLFVLAAEITQAGQVNATAVGKFMLKNACTGRRR